MESSPQLEGYRARGIEVLLLPDPIDPFWLQTATGYDGKPFKSVAQGDADINAVPLKEGETDQGAEVTPQIATLFAYMKQTLGAEVSDVRASNRLSSSAACLVAASTGLDRRLERMLAEHGRSTVTAPVLEINAGHALVQSLARRFAEGGEDEMLQDAVWLILDEARVVESESVRDPIAFAARLTRALTRAIG
jgi:molecular chaperone HtpG